MVLCLEPGGQNISSLLEETFSSPVGDIFPDIDNWMQFTGVLLEIVTTNMNADQLCEVCENVKSLLLLMAIKMNGYQKFSFLPDEGFC